MVKNKKAFTLVELLAVIVILAVILVIAVPQIMNLITESRKGALASAAKLIASSAETAYISNQTLGIEKTLTCQDVSNYNETEDYTCDLKFEDGKAKVTLTGHNKFNGMYVCDGTKENAEVVSESCTLVSFSVELNGGSDTVDYQGKYEAGSKVILVEPTKEGHTFARWTVSPEDGASINGNELTMGTVPVAIIANWTKNTYTITYELDGGTNGKGNPVSGEYGVEITLNNPTKTGYTFNGWTAVGGSLNDNKLTIGTSNVTLTASWEVPPFRTDSWATIKAAVDAEKKGEVGAASKYKVGDTREIDLGSLGKHTLRIANNSHYVDKGECKDTEGNELASQTACGFVIEFADIITTHNMNPSGQYDGTQYNYGWNKDGWPGSKMYDYLNVTEETGSGTIYNALVTAIGDIDIERPIIIDTTVVSGHGYGDTKGELANDNFESKDKIYLLSTREVWGKEGTSNQINFDSADGDTITRQLDYYKNNNVSTSSYSGAISQKAGTNSGWWLRSARSDSTRNFYYVTNSGDWNDENAKDKRGVSPAFRLG